MKRVIAVVSLALGLGSAVPITAKAGTVIVAGAPVFAVPVAPVVPTYPAAGVYYGPGGWYGGGCYRGGCYGGGYWVATAITATIAVTDPGPTSTIARDPGTTAIIAVPGPVLGPGTGNQLSSLFSACALSGRESTGSPID